MISHHRTTGRMRGPATLTLMSLLLVKGGAQPMSPPNTEEQSGGATYPKSFDCGGNAELIQDDSGATLTCDGNKVRVYTTTDMLADSVVSNLRHIFSTLWSRVRMARLSI